ncbi:MAG: phage portal protein [Clostridiales bacterium]|nr:phage portal protein [Clostridiales bacterium]
MLEIFKGWLTPYINGIIRQGAESRISDKEFVRRELNKFFISPLRNDMLVGERYYIGIHDILKYKRTAIGPDGETFEVKNLPNSRIVNNQYGKLTDQKVNYLLGKEIVFKAEDEAYSDLLNNEIFDAEFDRTIQQIGEDCFNCGIGWLYIYYDNEGKIRMERLKPWQVLPGWADDKHTVLDYAIRAYPVIKYEGKNTEKEIIKIEVYTKRGITRLVKDGANIDFDTEEPQVQTPYFYAGGEGFGWERIPLVAFRANRNELPLLKRVKSLQDGLNLMLSSYSNNMQEDCRNTILVLKNYDGENLGEFRRNLAAYGAVKVRTGEGGSGGVDTLRIEVNSENYKVIIDLLKKAIIENAMGYDAKDDRLSGNANQMNIQSMYSDIDLDANKMETEFKASLNQVLWFVNAYLSQTGRGDFEGENVDIIFNRDVLINEGEAIENCVKSVGIISDETIVSQHPWVNDVEPELERLKKQKEKEQEQEGYEPFGKSKEPPDDE